MGMIEGKRKMKRNENVDDHDHEQRYRITHKTQSEIRGRKEEEKEVIGGGRCNSTQVIDGREKNERLNVAGDDETKSDEGNGRKKKIDH